MSALLTSTTMRAARHGSRSFGRRCRVTAGASTGRRQNAVDESLPFGVGRVVFLYGSAEGRPVVGHRLREFKQLGGQVLGAAKCDPQFPGPQRNAGGKILEEALVYIRRSRNAHMLRCQLSTREVEGLHQAGAAVPFPLENPAVRRPLQARDESLPRHRRGVTDPQALERPTMICRARRWRTRKSFSTAARSR